LVFVWAAISKSVYPDQSERMFTFLVGAEWADAARWSVGFGEWALGSVLLLGLGGRASLFAASAVLVAFNGGLLFLWGSGFHGTCGCLGIAQSVESAMVKNAALIGVGVVGWSLHPPQYRTSGTA
jgi:uncharacterized membrane protein YphA (DoxX/SURF4 family)